ncbi:prephenate dehydratase [Oharaeibacter diazotrophicus]|uniref:prephenate dehydratase n=1 Tax=Oharaeibacter diazotrophicus TaxID=1920512 RepID=A0A4R6R9A8_9HYPH|nr:prephenate dehydratase [Oharaeibacter diazotrophicus]TDP82542.1 prephenate dehydratase [Oharaeibacter diazotrophicus]BBE72694.1 P-protein [Pleomorphomonas sp. SM30]GLS76729.1 prephenate dehydratase [Oharaeibacter diazotrophicus]
MKKKVVFQGEPGANSHLAALEVYPDCEPVPCPTFEDCFAALAAGTADLGMIPIENSVAGRVADIHTLLPGADLHIVGEHFLPIHHQLMGLKGAALSDLRVVQSHVQALGQCRKTLRGLGLTAVIGADTAGSAREIAERGDRARGALASRLAAEIYGLDILKNDVEDEAHNTTRFIILSPEPAPAPALGTPTITTFLFRVRNMPAALYKALGGFATNGVNMTKLESYQLAGQFFASQFYADVEGHPDETALRFALEELAFFSHEVRILGAYPASPFRETIREPEAERGLRPGE